VSYGVIAFAPAGRASGEALRATLLARYVGGARAAAVGTVSQALALVTTGLVSLPCALAARIAGADTLAISLLLQAIVLSVLGALVLVAARRREVGSLLRRFRKVADAGDAYVEAMHALPPLPLGALGMTLAGRGAQLLLLTTWRRAAPLGGGRGSRGRYAALRRDVVREASSRQSGAPPRLRSAAAGSQSSPTRHANVTHLCECSRACTTGSSSPMTMRLPARPSPRT